MPGNTPEYNALYYQKNRDRIVAHRKSIYDTDEDKAKRKIASAKRHIENPHLARERRRIRRAMEMGVLSIPYSEQSVLDLYGTNCHICCIEIDLLAPRQAGRFDGWEMGLHIDHLIPISSGGTNTLHNVRPAHARCNLQKGKKPLQLVVQERF